MPVHHFDTEDARLYGVDCAVILYNLKFWLSKNKANQQNIHDGRVWTYNSQEAWCDLFPYYTRRQVQRILKKLSDEGILLKGNYNDNRFVKTVWYSLDLPEYRLEAPESPIAPNGAIESTERCYREHQTVQCLQIKNTDSKSVNNSEISKKSADQSGNFVDRVMTELLAVNLPPNKHRYALLKIREYQERFPGSNSVADCYSYVEQAVVHQVGLTG